MNSLDVATAQLYRAKMDVRMKQSRHDKSLGQPWELSALSDLRMAQLALSNACDARAKVRYEAAGNAL